MRPLRGKGKTNSNSKGNSKSKNMAIFHLHAQVIKRSAGRSSVAAAAYRLGMSLEDARTGASHDYTRKGGVDGWKILAPSNAPQWAHDPAQLWNRVEAAEKRKDAQVARDIDIAIPRELSPDAMRELVEEYTQAEFVERGMVAQIAFHNLDGDNPHAHIMLTTRDIGPDGFGQKNRDWNAVEMLEGWRSAWATHANARLAQASLPARIDHRTLKAQGIEREPTTHQGPRAAAMQRRGLSIDRVRRWLTHHFGAAILRRREKREAPSPTLPNPPGRRPGLRR